MVAMSGMAFADITTSGANAQQHQSNEATSVSAASNQGQGNGNTIVFEAQDMTAATREAGAADISVALINSEAAKEIARTGIRNTPSVSGSPLVSSNDTCMGSASGAVNGPGFGVALGKTYTDENCVMLKNSRELWNMGMKAASLALMCNDSKNRDALELTGFVCPQTERDNKARVAAAKPAAPAAVASSTGYTGDDPIIRARFGLK
jgi:hypothetical protein